MVRIVAEDFLYTLNLGHFCTHITQLGLPNYMTGYSMDMYWMD